MRSCVQIPPVSFSDPSLSLDCISPAESVSSEAFTPKHSFHLNIRKADLAVRLVPKAFEVELPWLPNFNARVGEEGEIRSSVAIRDNQIALMLSSLLTFHDIQVDGPWDWDISPDRVLVGEYGGLHFLFGTTPDRYASLIDSMSFLNLWYSHCLLGLPPPKEICSPLGWEEPARMEEVCEAWPQRAHDLNQCCAGAKGDDDEIDYTPSPWPSPSRGEGTFLRECIRDDHPLAYCRPPEFGSVDDPRLDLTITPWIPAWLANFNGRLPEAMNWLELLHRFLSRPEEKKSQETLEKFFEKVTFSNGSRPWKLFDFLEKGEAQIALEDFSLSLDPMDLGGFKLLEGEIRSGNERIGPKDEIWQAGVSANWDLTEGLLIIRGNLEAKFAVQAPGLGDIRIKTPIFFSGQFKKIGEKLDLVPGTFFLDCPELEAGGDALRLLHRSAAGGSSRNDTARVQFALNDASGEFHYHLHGRWENEEKSTLEMKGSIPVGIRNERYLWQELKDDLEIFSAIKLFNDGHSPWEANLYLNTFRPALFVAEPGSPDQGIRLEVDLFRGEKPILEGGRIQFQRIETPTRTGRQWLHFLQMEADYLDAGDIVLKNPSLNAEWDQIPNGPEETHFRVSRASFHANTKRSEGGRIRGPVSLEVNSRTHPLEVIWNPRNQDIQIKDLEASLSAQGISLPADLLAKQRRERIRIRKDGGKPKARIEALGVDGKIQGRLHFNMKAMKGEGDLKLVGDREGDVYFLNQKGRPVQPPLISRTQWRFRRFDDFHWKQGFVLGAFRLFTRVNTMSLARFGHQLPFEADVVMTHRDVMFKPGGIDAANRKFYRRLLGERKADAK